MGMSPHFMRPTPLLSHHHATIVLPSTERAFYCLGIQRQYCPILLSLRIPLRRLSEDHTEAPNPAFRTEHFEL